MPSKSEEPTWEELIEAWTAQLEFERERQKEWGDDARPHSWGSAWRDRHGNPIEAP